MDHYHVLGLSRKARAADVKRAYRRLARRYHPDLNPGDRAAEIAFKQIQAAYEALGDPQRRRAYDREADAGGGAAAAPAPAADGGRGPSFDPADFAQFTSFFADFFGARGSDEDAARAPRPGDDVSRAVALEFFDALRGTSASLEIDSESACVKCQGLGRVPAAQRRPCPDCAGTGRVNRFPGALRLSTVCRRCGGEGFLGWDGCGACAGAGVLTRRETIQVRLPPGVDDGSRVRVPGKGRAGRNGGPPGDLYIITRVAPHPFFRRIGDNIHCTVPITVPEAALGTRIEVPTIDGRARVRIPPGTETGQKFRLRGKGAPSLRGTARGDQYVEARVVTPRSHDARARHLLSELGALEVGDQIRRGLFG